MSDQDQKFLYEFVGNKISVLRKEAGYSQQILAEKLGKSRVSIVNIEKGRQHTTLALIVELSIIFKVPLDEFVPQKNDSKSSSKLRTRINKEVKTTSKNSGKEIDRDSIYSFLNSIKK